TETGTRLTKSKMESSNAAAREYLEVIGSSSFVFDQKSWRDITRSSSERTHLGPGTRASWPAFGPSGVRAGRRSAYLLLFGSRKILPRVDGLIVDAHLIMQVRPRRSSGRANEADSLTSHHSLADAHINLRKVTIAGR